MIKSKSIKLSNYYEIRKAEYTYIQVIPSKSCRNTNTDKVLSLANTMYRKLDNFNLLSIINFLFSILINLSNFLYIVLANDKTLSVLVFLQLLDGIT